MDEKPNIKGEYIEGLEGEESSVAQLEEKRGKKGPKKRWGVFRQKKKM